MVKRERLIEKFVNLVSISSVSRNEKDFKEYLKKEFIKRGLNPEEDNAGEIIGGNAGNLFIQIPGTVDASPVLFAAHMDTVKPGEGIKAVVDGDIIRSQGDTVLGADDKAAIAVLMEVYDILREENLLYPPLEFLFTVAEEEGLKGAKSFDFTRVKAKKAYVLDAGGSPGSIVIKSPWHNEIEYTVYGKAAHAGMDPENGINAIKAAGRALAKMPCGRIDEETTCNFGVIEGGKARNIVADICRIKGEARSLSKDKLDRLTHELKEIFVSEAEKEGARAEVKIESLYPGVNLDKESEVVKIAEKACLKIGLKPNLTGTGGGSDASIINGSGIPCVNLGIGMSKVHTAEEYIKIEDLIKDVELVLAIIEESIKESGSCV
ncbi:M20/M25/M40 family metallo-hydrolase [Thermosyntropha sp.]|uniref:M20/M25/M40 family metallo-hydrolase n=1 Tax=Thermosyntropha sp. TaxID=2740820 RepID=UPI0025D92C4C|nr:M20/M25/M40 family metallo-hydrolase [Thermosyntropha sp.]MBO8159176.1 M20/M25/M40 family metallo-hydrolase [Thermosyntropha sp.]